MFKIKYLDRSIMASNSNDQYVKLRNNDDPWFKVYDNGIWYKVPNTKMRIKRRWFFNTPNYAIFNPVNSKLLGTQNEQFNGLQSRLERFLNHWEQRIKNNIQGDCQDLLNTVDFAGKTKFLQHYQQTVRWQPARSRWPLSRPHLLSRFFNTRLFDSNGNYLDVKSDKLGVWKINHTELSNIFRGYLPRFEMSESEIFEDIQEELTNLNLQLSLDQQDLSQRMKELGAAQENLTKFQATLGQKAVEFKTVNAQLNETKQTSGFQSIDPKLTEIDQQIAELKGQLQKLETTKEQLKTSIADADSKPKSVPKNGFEQTDELSVQAAASGADQDVVAKIKSEPIDEPKDPVAAEATFGISDNVEIQSTDEKQQSEPESVAKEPDVVVQLPKTDADPTEPTIDAKSVTVMLDPEEQEVSKSRIQNQQVSETEKTVAQVSDKMIDLEQETTVETSKTDQAKPGKGEESVSSTSAQKQKQEAKVTTKKTEKTSDLQSETPENKDQEITDPTIVNKEDQVTESVNQNPDSTKTKTELAANDLSDDKHNETTDNQSKSTAETDEDVQADSTVLVLDDSEAKHTAVVHPKSDQVHEPAQSKKHSKTKKTKN